MSHHPKSVHASTSSARTDRARAYQEGPTDCARAFQETAIPLLLRRLFQSLQICDEVGGFLGRERLRRHKGAGLDELWIRNPTP